MENTTRKFYYLFLLFIIILIPSLVKAQDELPESPLINESWERLGGPPGGIGYDIRIDSINSNIMYVTDNDAGIHKSVDGGTTWFPINEGIKTRVGITGEGIPVFSVTIDPHDHNVLWLGTQDTSGIYKSTDGGMLWEEKVNGIHERFISFRGFTIDPNNQDIIYAAGEIPSYEWGNTSDERVLLLKESFDITKGVVYKTEDSGDSWKPFWYGDNLARYVWIDPYNSNRIWISTGIFDRNASNIDPENYDPGGVGVVYTEDGGQTWQEFGENEGLTGLYVGSLFLHPEDSNILIAGTGNDEWSYTESFGNNEWLSPRGAYLSYNGGLKWEKVKNIDEIISSVEFCKGNPNVVYAVGEWKFFRSSDGAKTWQQIGPYGWGAQGRKAGIPIDLACDPTNPDRIFVNSYDGGNILSTDGGETWQDASQGYSGSKIEKLIVHPTNPAYVYATSNEGVAVSKDGGKTWEFRNKLEMDFTWVGGLFVDRQDPSLLMTSLKFETAIYRSTDEGGTWKIVHGSAHHVQGGTSTGFIDFIQSTNNTEIIYASGRSMNMDEMYYPDFDKELEGLGIYKSIDRGENWESASEGLPESLNINAIALDQTNNQNVFAGTFDDGVYHSEDGGNTWGPINRGIDGIDIRSISISPEDPKIIIVGTAAKGVYISQDGGENWIRSSAGMDPEAFILDIEFDPTNPLIIWAADFFAGVYVSIDGGNSWQKQNDGLSRRSVTSLAISNDGLTMYAGTFGGGVFRLSIHSQDYFDSLSPKIIEESTTVPEPIVTENQSGELEESTAVPEPIVTENQPLELEETPNNTIVTLIVILGLIVFVTVLFYRKSKLK